MILMIGICRSSRKDRWCVEEEVDASSVCPSPLPRWFLPSLHIVILASSICICNAIASLSGPRTRPIEVLTWRTVHLGFQDIRNAVPTPERLFGKVSFIGHVRRSMRLGHEMTGDKIIPT